MTNLQCYSGCGREAVAWFVRFDGTLQLWCPICKVCATAHEGDIEPFKDLR